MPEPEERPARKGRIVDDPEILAMHDCLAIVDGLDADAKCRVMAWLNMRCGVDHFSKTVTEDQP